MTEETAIYRYAVQVYEAMLSRSELDESGVRCFVGSMTDIFKECGASTSYYTPLRNLLLTPTDDPCIKILQRGNVRQPSIIELYHPPNEAMKIISAQGLTNPDGAATLVAGLRKDVQALKDWRESTKGVNIVEVLKDFEERITALEEQTGGSKANGKT